MELPSCSALQTDTLLLPRQKGYTEGETRQDASSDIKGQIGVAGTCRLSYMFQCVTCGL